MPAPLILASTSRYRQALLDRLGLPYAAVPPACDEEALKDPALTPQALAERLAEAKARSLQAAHPAAVIIGSDQVCARAGEILHKPGTAERAVAQLLRLQGGSHRLITALVVVHGPRIWRHTDVTTLTMRPLDRPALERYVAADQPLDCSGAYKLEQRGIGLFSAIESADSSAIVGLPLLALTRILAEAGYAIP
jgi:septum formation protein